MLQIISAIVASLPIAIASQTVFSVHDDLLAFPQFEVVFSDAFISDIEARVIIEQASSGIQNAPSAANTKEIESHNRAHSSPHTNLPFDPSHETYELMHLDGEQYLCILPVVDTPLRNETSEAEARAAEQKELARATDRGWELLQDLEGHCLYFMSGWWSYSFCYNSEITQFHSLPTIPGKPPVPDKSAKEFVLGRTAHKDSKEDEWGHQLESHKKPPHSPPKTELQVKGESRYLVQKMEGGTTCDLTGKPRRVEVQYHCNPHVDDRIGYIKEVTTCAYLMVVYTNRLCNDVAFMPMKENKANPITCRAIVPADELEYRKELKTLEESLSTKTQSKEPINIGGVILGGGKWVNKEGQRMPVPANFGKETERIHTETIAQGKSQADGGMVEMASEVDLQKLDLDPKMVEQLKEEVIKMAKEKGWKIEVVDAPGQTREILGIVDSEDDDEDGVEQGEEGEGSEEIFYKDEL